MPTIEPLNAKKIENAKHTGKGAFTTLSDGKGLELRVKANGNKVWYLRYQLHGIRRVPSIGDYPALSLKDARDKAEDMRRLLRSGIDPVEQAKAEAESRQAEERKRQAQDFAQQREMDNRRTLSSAINRWAELELSKRKDKGSEPMRAIRKDILTTLGNRDLLTITRGDILDALDTVIHRGARRMANRTFSDMKQFFRWAVEREWIAVDPLHGISKDRVGGSESDRDRYLTNTEIIELRDKLPSANLEPQAKAIIWIMLSTMCRVGEVIQARWEHINLQSGEWVIPASAAKNNQEHLVYLSDFARQQFMILRELNGWSDWVMPSPQFADRHACLKTVTRQIRDRQRDTPLSHRSRATGTLVLTGGTWTPHDLRRTGATIMAELGILSEIIERCLNHVEANRMKRVYQRHEYRAERREAWLRLGARLEEIVTDRARKVINIREAAK